MGRVGDAVIMLCSLSVVIVASASGMLRVAITRRYGES